MDDMSKYQRQLGSSDRLKVDEYLDTVREVERRIQMSQAQSDKAQLPELTRPTSVPEDWEEHVKLMIDLQTLAMQADLTRVVTFQLAREASTRTYPQIGVSDSPHPISHHGGDKNKIASLAKINAYHANLFAYYLEKLAPTSDGDATLLDNVIVLYGSAISEGNSHDIRNLPILLAGGGAGLVKGGRHVKYPDQTQRLTNLQLTLLNKLGVPTETFGDSTGEPINELSEV